MWTIINTGKKRAPELMALDAALLDEAHTPLLHFYDWQGPSATYGYFLNPADHLNMAAVEARGITLARRPTGGGLLFHLYDCAFSLILPATHPRFSLNTLANYATINCAVIAAIATFIGVTPQLYQCQSRCSQSTFCMTGATQYDVVINNKKVGGAAQRRKQHALLHQGTIHLSHPPSDEIAPLLLTPAPILAAMEANSYSLLEPGASPTALAVARSQLKQLLTEQVKKI